MAAHVRLKNKFTEDEKCHNLMNRLKFLYFGQNMTIDVLMADHA